MDAGHFKEDADPIRGREHDKGIIYCQRSTIIFRHQFAGLPGMTLMNSSEADWIANDPVYGVTFFREFQALITGSKCMIFSLYMLGVYS